MAHWRKEAHREERKGHRPADSPPAKRTDHLCIVASTELEASGSVVHYNPILSIEAHSKTSATHETYGNLDTGSFNVAFQDLDILEQHLAVLMLIATSRP